MNKYINVFLKASQYHPSWQVILEEALAQMNPAYLQSLYECDTWLPGIKAVFNAFSLPFSDVRYIFLGESPYPRQASANGYAFWDQAVTDLWSNKGLSKPVNRATSLRNFIKMLLLAEGKLGPHELTQPMIASLDKRDLIQTNQELFEKLLSQGFLLLNASLSLETSSIRRSALEWQAFLRAVFHALARMSPRPRFILLGKIAQSSFETCAPKNFPYLKAEHPYNLSFISNPDIIKLFQPFHLLNKAREHHENLSD